MSNKSKAYQSLLSHLFYLHTHPSLNHVLFQSTTKTPTNKQLNHSPLHVLPSLSSLVPIGHTHSYDPIVFRQSAPSLQPFNVLSLHSSTSISIHNNTNWQNIFLCNHMVKKSDMWNIFWNDIIYNILFISLIRTVQLEWQSCYSSKARTRAYASPRMVLPWHVWLSFARANPFAHRHFAILSSTTQ